MRRLLYAKDSEEFWQIFSEEREKRQKRLAKLPFAKKVAIIEKMQADLSHWSHLKGRRQRHFASASKPVGRLTRR